MAQNQKRQRGRNSGNRRNFNNSNRVYESNGPEVKIRGTAQTVYEKYTQIANDEQSGGDRIRAESLMQHAEHYYRVYASQQSAKSREDANKQNRNKQAEQAKSKNGEQAPQEELSSETADESSKNTSAANGDMLIIDPLGSSRQKPKNDQGNEHAATAATTESLANGAAGPGKMNGKDNEPALTELNAEAKSEDEEVTKPKTKRPRKKIAKVDTDNPQVNEVT